MRGLRARARGFLRNILVVTCVTAPSAAPGQPSVDPFELAEQAQVDLREGRLSAAAAGFERAFELWPHRPGWAYRAAQAQARLGQHARAMEWLNLVADFGLALPVTGVAAFDSLQSAEGFAAVHARFERNLQPLVRSQVAFKVPRRDLMPESVAYDPATDLFYLGSIYRRKILRVRRDGSFEDFVPERRDDLWGVLGMKLDARRKELWANACNLGASMAMAIPDSVTTGRGGIFRFELGSGRLTKKYVTGSAETPVCFNDLTIAPNGDVYASTGPGGVYCIKSRTDELELFHHDPGLWINGIAISEDGKTLFLADTERGILTLDVESRVLRRLSMPAKVTLSGIDGLYVHRHALLGIQNGVQPQRVVQAFLGDKLDRVTEVRVLESNHPLYDVPTTGVLVGDTLYYVATTQLDSFDKDGKLLPWEQLKDNVILRLEVPPR
jgi:sugar lactone lactonase YvrE